MFDKAHILVLTGDGQHVTLMEPLTYTAKSGEVIVIPKGATSDGASVPRAFWARLPPFGAYWLAAVLHDYLYRETKRPKSECDNLLLEAMESLGVDKITRDAIYQGVHFGGGSAFADDRR